MTEALHLAGWLMGAIAVLGALYAIVAGVLVRRDFRRLAPLGVDLPAVTLLKPLHGVEPGLWDHLESFCAQDYPAPVQIIFGVQDRFDPAVAVVMDLKRRHPDQDIVLVVDERLYGLNRKVSNLVNMQPYIRHGVVVLTDADISVDKTYLSRVAPILLSSKDVGFVTCSYVGKPMGGLWSQLSAMAVNYHFLPSVAVGMALKLARPCFGATIAFRKSSLDEIGGFLPLADRLADDYEIGRAIAAGRPGFALPPFVVAHACAEANLRELVSHELRWARTIRAVDPAGFAGSGVTHALPLAMISALLLGPTPGALTVVVLAAAARIYLRREVDRATGFSAGVWWLTPLRDFVSLGVFIGAFLETTVRWQGESLQVAAGGGLTPNSRA